jgi:hypothetical protein
MAELLLVAAHCLAFLPVRLPLVHLFDLDAEVNFPTWFSTMQLAIIAATALGICSIDKPSYPRLRDRAGWILLAAAFAFLSLDEFVQIHEILDRHRDIFPYKWCFYYAPVAAVVGGACIVFLYRRFPRGSGLWKLFLVGCALLGAGAMGMELVDLALVRSGVRIQLLFRLEVILEEFLEMLGGSVILCTLLSHAQDLVVRQLPALQARGSESGHDEGAAPRGCVRERSTRIPVDP